MTSTDSVYSSIQSHDGEIPQPGGRWKLFLYSAIGAFVFFLPVTYQDKRSIPLDHLVTMVREGIPAAVPWIVFALAVYGTARSFTTGAFKESALQAVFAVLNIVGAVISFLMVIDALPWVLGDEDLVPFLLELDCRSGRPHRAYWWCVPCVSHWLWPAGVRRRAHAAHHAAVVEDAGALCH